MGEGEDTGTGKVAYEAVDGAWAGVQARTTEGDAGVAYGLIENAEGLERVATDAADRDGDTTS